MQMNEDRRIVTIMTSATQWKRKFLLYVCFQTVGEEEMTPTSPTHPANKSRVTRIGCARSVSHSKGYA
jgi:hypothetical protein